MRLYDFPASPHCLKVRAVAHELGVDLDIVEVNILRGESRSRSGGVEKSASAQFAHVCFKRYHSCNALPQAG